MQHRSRKQTVNFTVFSCSSFLFCDVSILPLQLVWEHRSNLSASIQRLLRFVTYTRGVLPGFHSRSLFHSTETDVPAYAGGASSQEQGSSIDERGKAILANSPLPSLHRCPIDQSCPSSLKKSRTQVGTPEDFLPFHSRVELFFSTNSIRKTVGVCLPVILTVVPVSSATTQ